MPGEESVIPKFAECKGCGAKLLLIERIIKCPHCGLLYEYHPERVIYPILEFECGDRPPVRVLLSDSIIIGRDDRDRDYVKVRSKYDEMKTENTYIRNIFVSRNHVMIFVKEETMMLSDSREIVTKKRCFIEDLGSTNKTELNGSPLRLGKQLELKHNDVIVLAPKTTLPLAITLKEELCS